MTRLTVAGWRVFVWRNRRFRDLRLERWGCGCWSVHVGRCSAQFEPQGGCAFPALPLQGWGLGVPVRGRPLWSRDP